MRPAFIAMFLGTLVLLCPPLTAKADTTGSIAGRVTDAGTGAPIADATVDIQSPADVLKTVTDSHGYYVALCLDPSTYTITIRHLGYFTVAQPGVVVIPGRQSLANVKLPKRVRIIAHIVDLTASALLKQHATADVYELTMWSVPYYDSPGMRLGGALRPF